MLKSYNFPSVYEATNQELANVAENILDGIKINLDDTDYIVGNLALVEGYSPHKSINAAPTDEEYKLLSEASLLLTQPKGEEEIYLTTGFPFATYILYRHLRSRRFDKSRTDQPFSRQYTRYPSCRKFIGQ